MSSQPATSDPSSTTQGRTSSVVSTPRYEEVAHYRLELEEAKRENDMLKRRIRELERMISTTGDGSRGRRSGSVQRNGDATGEVAANGTSTPPAGS